MKEKEEEKGNRKRKERMEGLYLSASFEDWEGHLPYCHSCGRSSTFFLSFFLLLLLLVGVEKEGQPG